MSEDVSSKVKKIVADHLGIDEAKVTEESSFIDDLGADSLDTVELVMAFEEEFGSEISDSEAEKILTVGDAVKFIEGKALRIEYDGHMDKIHLYKNAEVKRGDDIVVGDYITYDASAEVAQAMSSKNDSSSGKKSRTKAIIKPKD